MSSRSRSLALGAALGCLALGGCGDRTQAPTEVAEGGLEPVTARALAYVAAEHTGPPTSAMQEHDAAEEFTSGGVGAELSYDSDGESDGSALVVAVGKGLDPAMVDCEAEETESLDGCVSTDRGVLMWEDVAFESDPGVVYVLVDKGESSVLLFYGGPPITGDPRELDLPISTEVLFDIAHDPRMDVTTSAEAVREGEGLSYWGRTAD